MKEIEMATYQYEIPFLFCGTKYYDSASLVNALIEHWDKGLMAVKRGEMAAFFDCLAEEDQRFEKMAKDSERLMIYLHTTVKEHCGIGEDVEYAKLLLSMEPSCPGVPVIWFNDRIGEICGTEEYEAWKNALKRPDGGRDKWNKWILQQYEIAGLFGDK